MCYTNRQIDNRVKQLKTIMDEIEKLTAAADGIRAELKADLEECGCEERQTDNFLVKWKTVITNRLDSKALKAALPDVFHKYSRQMETRRFTVA